MATYNYLAEMKTDICNYIRDMDKEQIKEIGSLEALSDYLNAELFAEDMVTGNASGSYFCNYYEAEEALSHNWDLLAEALEEFGQDGTDVLKQGAEAMDVTIRCYLLSQAIDEVLQEDFSDLYDDDDDDEEQEEEEQ